MERLIRQYPRDGWAGHPNFGPVSRYWLHKHDGFRRIGGLLTQRLETLDGDLPRDMAAQRPLLSGLQHYLGHLQGHHAVEDHHYFPAFRRLEPAAAAGFARLEADHVRVDAGMRDIADRWAAIHRLWADGRPHAAEVAGWRGAIAAFIAEVDRHLDDEEDLIIPVLLKHGEAAVY